MNKYLIILMSLYFMSASTLTEAKTSSNIVEKKQMEKLFIDIINEKSKKQKSEKIVHDTKEKKQMQKLFASIISKKSEKKESNKQKSKENIKLEELKSFLNSIQKPKKDMKAIDFGDYASGCELISIVNLLNYYRYNTTLDEFYNNFFEHKDWYMVNHVIYAPDPNYIYPGNPKIEKGDNCGFGCFGEAVKRSIDNFFSSINSSESEFYNQYNIKHKVVFETGAKKERVKELLDKKTPIIIWSTQASKESENGLYDMRESGGPGNSWIMTDPEESKDKKYTWLRGEHCSVIYDYDESSYSVCDPFRKNIKIKKDSLDKSREIFDNQIVYLIKNPK